ncbi:ABC transporter [Burkholderia ubonensis]|uniref:ABC transporter ATP-binding protein n=1 Tax=Burkholderia ubonensis TaxID=101571 RepID=UPI0007577A89|nr:ABC transporter ATP-binding protein [Burkholderia ubonensis]KVV50741.1 ABC transporter [Burkholderia ubonensis]KVW24736.1 ABC transporter [Burkholderia ubonensis]
MSSDAIISVTDLGKCYQLYAKPSDRLKQMLFGRFKRYYTEFWALKDVSFDVRKGETIGIIGRNGAGKSTLLQMLSGVLQQSVGHSKVRGRVCALLELGAGFNPEFTGRENAILTGAIYGIPSAQMEAKLREIEAFADIGDHIDQPVKHYSSGMYARLAFSVAIHVDPEILIVDEILAVGDALFQRKCMNKFYEFRDRGCTVLFVTHDAYQIKSTCQRALYLKNGRQVAFGDATEVVDRYLQDLELVENKPALSTPTLSDTSVGGVPEEPVAITQPASLIRITDVTLTDEGGSPMTQVQSGQTVEIRFRYRATRKQSVPMVSFVVNLYRHDSLYICGTTTIMDGLEPFVTEDEGEVIVRFPDLQLLAGRYMWRVAINDERGLGILTEATPVCEFRVVDAFQAVGLVNVPRQWIVHGKVAEKRELT